MVIIIVFSEARALANAMYPVIAIAPRSSLALRRTT